MELGKNLTKALLAVQQSLDAVAKSGQNAHLKSRYATLPDVLDELLPKCHEAGLVVLQRTLDNESIGVLKLETLVIHAESSETLAMVTPMPVPQTSAQAYGSALTYARRYALMALFGMKAEDDDGHTASNPARFEAITQPTVATGRTPSSAYQQNYQAAPARIANGYTRNGGGATGSGRENTRIRETVPEDERFYEETPAMRSTASTASTGFESLPTDRQKDMLQQLGYEGESPRTRAEASQIISRLKAERVSTI